MGVEMKIVELRLPSADWLRLRNELGTNKMHFSDPEREMRYGTPNFVMTVGSVEVVVIKDSDSLPVTRHDLTRLVYERNELLEATMGMVQQHYQERTKGIYESGFLSANAFALRTLCELGAMQMDQDGYGRWVTAKEICDFDAFKSSGDWRAMVNPPLIEGEL